ncbi:unnamed protein product [Tenebrio molitor]|nr:unnamed protein product [Tenebrio molitor]
MKGFRLMAKARNCHFASACTCGASAHASNHKPPSHFQNYSFWPCDRNNYSPPVFNIF